MEVKRLFFSLIVAVVFMVMPSHVVSAQGVDPILTQLLQENKVTVALGKSHRLKRVAPRAVNGVDTLEIQRRVNVSFHSDGSIRQLCILGTLADGASCPDSQLEALGIKTVCKVGRLVIMDVPAEAFGALSHMTEFKWLAADNVHELSNQKARETNTVKYVNNEAPYTALDESRYTGLGVVVGVIDQGIDFNHVAFKSNDGKGDTRIKEAVYFKASDNQPTVVTDVNEIVNLTTGNTVNSHGTHTSATAAGSYVGEIAQQGMAPGADLVLADCSNSLSDSHIISSAQKIVEYARETAKKPCVINVSLGHNPDFHDGSNALATAFNELSSEAVNHCIFVVSAGNEANEMMSIQKTLNSGNTVKTIMETSERWQETQCANYADGLSAFIYSTDGNSFTVDYHVVDITNGTVYTLADKPLVDNNATTVSLPTESTKRANSKFALTLSTDPCHFTEQNMRLAVTLTAGADGQKIIMTSNKLNFVGKDSTNLEDYTDGNGDMSINVIACTDGVISVGSYMDRSYWQNYTGVNYHTPAYSKYPVGSIAPYSSYGVDANGKARPDVIATGTYITSAYNAYDDKYFTGEGITKRVPIDGNKPRIAHVLQGDGIGDGQRPYFYGVMSGTSMAAPMVTGIIALWLEKDPNLTTAQVRELLRSSSIQDQYTTIASKTPSGNLVQAGCGKIDALRGILTLENATRAEGSKIALDEVLTIPSGRNITTFSSSNMLDFRNPNGPKAYIASSMSDNTLTFKRVLDRVPMNTGLLITSNEGSYNVPLAPAANAIETNYLHGTAETSYRATEEGSIYVLSKQNGKIGFYQNAANLEVPSGKAYLVLPAQASGAKSITFDFDENVSNNGNVEGLIGLPEEDVLEGRLDIGGQVNGIETVENNQTKMTGIYDLQGRKVLSPKRGLYIMGGKKVLFID